MAEALNRPDEEVNLFRKRADYYKNVFDNETNFMRGKMKDGNFQSPLGQMHGRSFYRGKFMALHLVSTA